MTGSDQLDSRPDGAPGPGTPAPGRLVTLLAWSLAAQLLLWGAGVTAVLVFVYSSDDPWFVLARTRFAWFLARTQLGMLWYYLGLGALIGLWLWVMRAAWWRYHPPRSRWTARAGLVGLWLWLVVTVLAYAVCFHFGSFWSVRTFLADRYGLLVHYSDLPVARSFAWCSRWALILGTVAVGGWLLINWLGSRAARPLLKRLAWVVPVVSAGVILAIACWPDGRTASVQAAPRARRADLPNVIILGSDSMRADHLGCYGYQQRTGRDTSPNIDRLAEQGVVLENMLSATGSTTDSWFSMLSGRWPHEHGIRCIYPTRRMAEAAARVPTVIRQANAAGYRTVVMGDWAACSFDSVDHGFQVCRTDPDMTFPDYIGRVTEKSHIWITAAMMNPICRWLGLGPKGGLNRHTYRDVLRGLDEELARASATGQPLLLVSFLSVTHMPYRVYEEFPVRFGRPDYRGPHERAMDVSFCNLFKEGAGKKVQAAKQRIIDLYDSTIWVFDQIVGQVVARLQQRGLLDDTVVIIMSDHGEDFYEPNTDVSHGKYLAAGLQSYRIPLVIHWPKRLRPLRVPQRLRTIDLAPTLTDLLGLPPLDGISGRSFLKHITAATPAELARIPDDRVCFFETGFLWDCPATYPLDGPHRAYPAMSQIVVPDPGWNYRMVIPPESYPMVMRAKDRAVLKGDWKLVYLAMRGRPVLRMYDIKKDPNCQHPVPFGNGPFKDLAGLLHAWITADPRQDFYLYEDMTRADFDALFRAGHSQ